MKQQSKRINVLLYLGSFFTIGSLFVFIGYKYDLIKTGSRQKLDEIQLLIENESEISLHKGLEALAPIASSNIGTRQEKHEALFYIATIYEKLNMPEIAKKKYTQLLDKITPSTVSLKKRIQFKIAKMKIMSLHRDEALIRLLILIKEVRDKNFLSEIYTELGRLYLISNKIDKAVVSLKIALQKKPDNHEAKILLSKIKKKSRSGCKRETVAIENCAKGSSIPDSVTKTTNQNLQAKEALKVAFGYYGQHNYTRAIQYFRKIIDCCRNTPEAEIAWFYSGTAYAMLGNHKRAIKAYKNVLGNTITARDQLSMIRIGQLYFKKENFKKAIDYFQKSQKQYPNGKYLDIAKEWNDEAKKSKADKEKYND